MTAAADGPVYVEILSSDGEPKRNTHDVIGPFADEGAARRWLGQLGNARFDKDGEFYGLEPPAPGWTEEAYITYGPDVISPDEYEHWAGAG